MHVHMHVICMHAPRARQPALHFCVLYTHVGELAAHDVLLDGHVHERRQELITAQPILDGTLAQHRPCLG